MEVMFEWQGKSVVSTVYLCYEVGAEGEPCLLGINVVISLVLMIPAPGVESCGGDSPSRKI